MKVTAASSNEDAIDDCSKELAGLKMAPQGPTAESFKEASGKSTHLPRALLRRRSSMHQVANAARREAGGIIAALGTGLAISVGGLLISMVLMIQPLAVSGLRSLAAVFYLLPALAFWRPRLWPAPGYRLGLVAVAVVLSFRALTFTLGSVALPLAEFSLLLNTMPLFTAILGCSLLGEKCGPREIASGLLVLFGAAVAFLPTLIMSSDATTSAVGIVVTLGCAFCQALSFVILRKLSDQVSPLTVTIWTLLITSVLCLPPAGVMGQLNQIDLIPVDLAYVAGSGITGLLSALLPAIACTMAEAGRVAIATTSSVVFSFALQAAVQLRAPTVWALVGAAFIVAAVVCSNLRFERSDVKQKLTGNEPGADNVAGPLPVKDYGALHMAIPPKPP
ncbi:solute carrier family 35 member G1 [Ixodes scapularis]